MYNNILFIKSCLSSSFSKGLFLLGLCLFPYVGVRYCSSSSSSWERLIKRPTSSPTYTHVVNNFNQTMG